MVVCEVGHGFDTEEYMITIDIYLREQFFLKIQIIPTKNTTI